MNPTLFQSKLPAQPQPVDLSAVSFSLDLNFGRADQQTRCVLQTNPESERAREIVPDRLKDFVEEGSRHLNNRPGYFSLSFPLTTSSHLPCRLHVASSFITFRDLERFVGVEARQDFDRVMDLVRHITVSMVEAGILAPKRHPIEIVPELYSHKGEVRYQPIHQAAIAIAASWMRSDEAGLLFRSYRFWNPKKAAWGPYHKLLVRK